MAIKSVKTINGKRYMLKGHYRTKSEAKNTVKWWKDKGWKVRRVRGEDAGYDGGYAVYMRKG